MKKPSTKEVVGSKLGKIKPELPQSVKTMMNQKVEEMTSKNVKLSVKKKK